MADNIQALKISVQIRNDLDDAEPPSEIGRARGDNRETGPTPTARP
jgi:hypothetical protein